MIYGRIHEKLFNTWHLVYSTRELDVLMHSSVLTSERALQVDIQIMCIYTKLRRILAGNNALLLKIELLESKTKSHDADSIRIYQYLKQLIDQPATPRKRIGYVST